ncbi:cell envelope biogenesis protein TonB [Bacteroidia bacterium]|nr:cell envelope biogenesis protein TonB [Bacteroidia bacterium]
MAKDFDLTSQKWLDLIFEGKNKTYGAYAMREESSDRHIKSLLIVTLAGLTLIYLPRLVSAVIPAKVAVEQTVEVEMVDMSEQEVPEENKLKMEEVEPPPLLKETVKLTPPVIDKDENVRDEDLMKTQEELTDTKAQISVADVEGVEKGGVDIADLQDHKVVTQDEPEKVYDHVEVEATFPGGNKEITAWLSKNIQYPPVAAEQGIQGKVILRFVVEKDGSIGEVQILRPLDPSLDKEAQRVVKKMPRWTPGKNNGHAVRVWFNLPITFRLE